jgi:hypothetical protein
MGLICPDENVVFPRDVGLLRWSGRPTTSGATGWAGYAFREVIARTDLEDGAASSACELRARRLAWLEASCVQAVADDRRQRPALPSEYIVEMTG